ncbi:MAG: trigger factor [Thermosynechococcaceae cyanobacterium MS004]|nr:trigger factor [Thermosynechococcaceae cyanobacterium MS004]
MSKTQERLKVNQEKLPGSQVSLEIEIPAERSQSAYEQTITKYMRTAQIPGFRKGKVPRQVIMQRFGSVQIKAAALEELIEKIVKEAVEQSEVNVIGNFQLVSSFEDLIAQFEPGTPISFTASVDVPPEATLKRYTGFQVQAEEVKYDPSQVDKVLDEQRSSRSTLVPVEGRAAEAGDVALLDFSGIYFLDDEKTDFQEIEGGTATDFQVELIEGQLIPGFTEGLIGVAPGETKELDLQFPEQYFQEELAGKLARFTITLKELKAKELPELDDTFAQEVSEFETLAELRDFLVERYTKEAQEKTDANVEEALITALAQEIEVDLPETLVSNEVNFLINQMASRLQGQGVDVNRIFTKEMIPGLKENFRNEAIGRIKRTLALAEVAEKESISIETESLEQRFQEVLGSLGDREIDRKRLREVLEDELLQEKVIAWLKERSEVTLVDKIEVEPEPEADELASDPEAIATEDPATEATAVEAEVVDAAATVEVKKKATRSRSSKAKATNDENA